MSIKGFSFYLFLSAIIAIVITCTKTYYLGVLEIVLFFIVYKKYGLNHVFIMIGIFVFFLLYKVNEKPLIDIGNIQSEFVVKEAKEKYMIVQNDKINYLVYYHDEEKFDERDTLMISGVCKEIENDLDIDVFEFKNYLNNKRVFYEIKAYKISLINKGFKPSRNIISKITNKLVDESYSMTMMLLFNDKLIDKKAYENLVDINAVHLFVVSGFHISFFFSIICKLFKNKKIGIICSFVFCSFYIFLLDFSISSTRALMSLFISKVLKDYFNRLDCVAIPGIILLLTEPLYIYNYSFIMSFLMVTVIAFSSDFLSKHSKIVQALLLSVICFIAIVPIQLVMNYKINFISLITNILLSYVVIVIFILCILGIFLSIFNGNIFGGIYKAFNLCIEKISEIESTLLFGSINIYLIILYYILFVFLLITIEKKWIKRMIVSFISIIIFMFLLYNRHWFLFYQQVTFLNVYQGDCIIIQDSFNGKVMLIDTGGLTYYDIASKKIMPYLEYHGIKKIDTIVITHDDFDHCGALDSLNSQIEIKEIIKDPYIEKIDVGKIHLTNLNKYFTEESSKNDQSIVLYGNICSYDFLFTGDISKEIEMQIYEYVYVLNVDVLKVAHHGSYTSSCKQFIEFISPTYAIISVGVGNFYGHPSKEVLKVLLDSGAQILRTDIDGTIKIKGKIFDNCFIETAK